MQLLCREILCDRRRYLWKEKCVKSIHSDDENCFRLFLKLVPLTRITFQALLEERDYATKIQNVVLNAFHVFENLFSLHGFEMYTKTSEPATVDYLILKLMLSITNTSSDILSWLVENIHSETISMGNDTIRFTSEFVVAETHVTEFGNATKLKIPVTPGGVIDSLERVDYKEKSYGRDNVSTCGKTKSVIFEKLLICPFIKFGHDEFSVKIENNFLYFEEFESKFFSLWEYRRQNATIFMCLSDYRRAMDDLQNSMSAVRTNSVNPFEPKLLLSFFCVCLSILCLLVTIITYVVVPVLHTQPGVNTVVFSACLLLAQSFYQFGAGQSSLSHWACSLIGAICHFLWLSTMFAMNVCSVDMFLLFRKLTITSPKFCWRSICRRILYITLSSLTFVIVNFTVSFTSSGGEKNGYGGYPCYLTSFLLHITTFIAPTFTIVMVNLILFFYVAIKISKSQIKSAQRNLERNFFGIYVRLSTLTGSTWLFGLLQLVIRSEALEYIFILLNASQGVFVMIAFVVNRRVYYICCREKATSLDTPDTSTSIRRFSKRTFTRNISRSTMRYSTRSHFS